MPALLSPPPRADLFGNIHKALRARLTALVTAAGCLDHADDAEVGRLLVQLRETLHLCRRHLELEERHVYPALEARRPGSVRHARHEHQQHLQAQDELLALAQRLEFLPALRRAPVADALYRALTGYLAHDLEHMALEELEHNRVLWDTHSDAEIHAIEAALRADLTPAERLLSLGSMLPALTPAERATLLTSMRATAPADVFAQAMALADRLLSTRDRTKLDAALGIARRPVDFVGIP